MSTTTPSTTTTTLSAAIRARLDAFFTTVGQGLNAYLEIRSRSAEVERLYTMSDAELAVLGITRDRIPHYVWRDRLFL